MNIEKRLLFANEIGCFLKSAKTTLNDILESIGWSTEHLKSNVNSNYVTCPYDSGHKIPPHTLEKHVEICSWVKRGYTKEEVKNVLPSSTFFYEECSTVATIMIDQSLQNYVLQTSKQQNSTAALAGPHIEEKDVPLTMDHALTELTSEERSAIYDYVVAQGKAANINNTFQVEELHMNLEKKQEPTKQKSRLEILAEQRDYKRRRQSYRAKNVHITKKSYKEVLREIIENQTQLLNPASQTADNLSHGSPSSSPAREILHESTSELPSHSKGRRDRSRSSERDSRHHSRPEEYKSHRHYRDEGSTSGRSRSSHKRKRSKSHERDNGYKRDGSKERSRTHHKKSHKKHKKHSHHHRHRRSSASDSDQT